MHEVEALDRIADYKRGERQDPAVTDEINAAVLAFGACTAVAVFAAGGAAALGWTAASD